MPMKLERKVIRTGAGGLCVTLPKGWPAFNGLRAGDRVVVVLNDSFQITPKVKP